MTRLVRLLLALLLGLGLTLGAWPAAAAETFPRTSSRWQTCVKKLDGITTKIHRSQRTVIIVNQTSRTYARVSFWVRRDAACSLTRKFLTRSARIGRNGTVEGTERKQGSMTTPRGTYTITETFGNGPAPYTSMPYHETRKGDYWVGDNSSRYYNTMRNSADGGFRPERIGEPTRVRSAVPLRSGDQLQPAARCAAGVSRVRDLPAREERDRHRRLHRHHARDR